MSDVYQDSLELHRKNGGKLAVKSKVKLDNKEDLSLAYTPCKASLEQPFQPILVGGKNH